MRNLVILFTMLFLLQGCNNKKKPEQKTPQIPRIRTEISLSIKGIKLGDHVDSIYNRLKNDTTITDLTKSWNGNKITFLSYLYDQEADKHNGKFVIEIYKDKIKRIQFSSSNFEKYEFEAMYRSKYGHYDNEFSKKESLKDETGNIWEWKNQRLIVSYREFDSAGSLVSYDLLQAVRRKGYEEHELGCRVVYEDKDITAAEEEDIRKEKELKEKERKLQIQKEREKNKETAEWQDY